MFFSIDISLLQWHISGSEGMLWPTCTSQNKMHTHTKTPYLTSHSSNAISRGCLISAFGPKFLFLCVSFFRKSCTNRMKCFSTLQYASARFTDNQQKPNSSKQDNLIGVANVSVEDTVPPDLLAHVKLPCFTKPGLSDSTDSKHAEIPYSESPIDIAPHPDQTWIGGMYASFGWFWSVWMSLSSLGSPHDGTATTLSSEQSLFNSTALFEYSSLKATASLVCKDHVVWHSFMTRRRQSSSVSPGSECLFDIAVDQKSVYPFQRLPQIHVNDKKWSDIELWTSTLYLLNTWKVLSTYNLPWIIQI